MAGSILPLPVMVEEELRGDDRAIYEKLEAPKSIVVRYGLQKMVAELPYNGDAKPGCGSKLVVRTRRGTEMAEMLTTTCPNSGCSKAVSRKDMLKYIENSGGKDYPFTTDGKVLRVATVADLNEQARLDGHKIEVLRMARRFVAELKLEMKPIEVEHLLGGERIIIHYGAEQWVDFRELVKLLAAELQTRIEMHQVNDREEARLVADYERCGQYCCCKNFLKVLKPVSMRSAKVQKATLDPQKISGRCGRLMCCLRYEDKTYEELRKKLPHRKTLVETEDGVGLVLNSQILTQLVLVKIGVSAPAAYPLESIRSLNKEESAAFRKAEQERAEEVERSYSRRSGGRSAGGTTVKPRQEDANKGRQRTRRPDREATDVNKPNADQRDAPPQTTDAPGGGGPGGGGEPGQAGEEGTGKRKRRRRRRGRRRKPGGDEGGEGGGNNGGSGEGGGGGDKGGSGGGNGGAGGTGGGGDSPGGPLGGGEG
jgi:cell fate regulator YaaT (PSP1 superfamily)